MATQPPPESGTDDAIGPVPEDNQPGHHPEHEQDKPSGDDFVRKVREHARAAEVEATNAVDESTPTTTTTDDEPEPTVAGDVLRATAGVLRKVRESIPPQ
jgi:hypothetical protein